MLWMSHQYNSSESAVATPMYVRRSFPWTCICWWTLTILLCCHTDAMGTKDKETRHIKPTKGSLVSASAETSSQSRHKACPPGSGIVSPNGKVHCCKNGGVPLLGTLCACPRNYEGRWCERRKQNCLRIPHGQIFRDDCTICRCMYGILSCISNAFKNCESNESDTDGSLRSYDTRRKHAKDMQRLISNSELLTKLASSGASTNYSYTFSVTLIVAIIALWWIT